MKIIRINTEKSYSVPQTTHNVQINNEQINKGRIALKQSVLYTGDYRTYPTPDWGYYNRMYELIHAVGTGVNKKASTIFKTGWHIKDQNGNFFPEIAKELNNRFNLDKIIQQASKHYDLYGTVIYKYNKGKKNFFHLISPAETINYKVDTETFEILEFTWVNPFKQNYIVSENFYVGVIPDSDDLVFGVPSLRQVGLDAEIILSDKHYINEFLNNSGFPSIIAMTSPDIEESTLRQLQAQLELDSTTGTRFKSNIIPNALDEEGNPLINITTISPKIESRSTLDEKVEMTGIIYDALHIPRKIMGQQTQGIGSDEYEVAINDYRQNCIEPRLQHIDRDLNIFTIPKALELLGKDDWFSKNGVKVKKGKVSTREALPDDFYFGFNDVDIEIPHRKRKDFLTSYELGATTLYDLKTKGFRYSQAEVPEEDKEITFNQTKPEYNKPNNDISSPNQTEIEPINIDREKQAIKQSSKVRNKIKQLLDTVDLEISLVEPLLEQEMVLALKRKLVQSMKTQYLSSNIANLVYTNESVDEILNKIVFKPSADIIMTPQLTLAMLYATEVAIQYIDRTIPVEGSIKHRYRVDAQSFVQSRINNLMGASDLVPYEELYTFIVPEQYKERVKSITNPYYDGNLDETTRAELAAILLAVAAGANLLDEIDNRVNNRVELIVNDNISKSLGFGLFAGGVLVGAKQKQWLRTISIDPREKHLAQVGEIVGYFDYFSDGSFWSNELINCKCGIKVIN